MDPTLEEKQNNQAQQKRSAGESTINTINNLAGAKRLFKNPFGKIGSRALAQTSLRGIAAFLAVNLGIWLVLGIIILVIVVFLIVFLGFFGGIPGAPTLETTPTIAPTETITPTPAP